MFSSKHHAQKSGLNNFAKKHERKGRLKTYTFHFQCAKRLSSFFASQLATFTGQALSRDQAPSRSRSQL
eukprot:s284_g9.t1